MTIEEAKRQFPAGTKVVHKDNPNYRGTVVGKSFGTPEPRNVRVQLECGLTVDVSPYALKEIY